MKFKLAATVAVLSLFANIAAEAETLNPINGVIFTRTGGQGFHKVTSPTQVEPGDTVMAANDGNAQIVLCDGTVITVGSGQVITVPQCSRVVGATQSGGIDPTYALIGAGVAVAAGVGIYYATKGSAAATPASP